MKGAVRSGEAVIEVEGVTKVYRMGPVEVHALRGVGFTVRRGEFVVVRGPSGSGKSTLLNILGCLDRPTSGSYRLEGQAVGRLGDRTLARTRNCRIGFVFQTFNLLPRLSALGNVMLPLVYGDGQRRARRERAGAALEAVGLGDRLNHRPNELSGGERQRVAIARALVTDPAILLADEPTGNLDSVTGQEVMALLSSLHAQGRIIILVTHDAEVARYAQRTLWMQDGRLREA
jgi:putative ABC transport system ATP-binding protein